MLPIIDVKQLEKSFGASKVLHGIDMKVYRGDIYGFLGPNGAGKSTTIRCILSLITPDKGEIRLFGKSIAAARNEILRNIGCIIEKPDLYNELSAEKNLHVSSLMYGLKISKKEIHKTLDLVGLKGKEQAVVGTFSQGMKQRMGIAQSLLHNPELIILDEPASGLDPQGIIDIRVMIKQLKEEFGKTIFLSSHDLSEIELIADRMIVINKGKTIVEGNVLELLSENDLRVEVESADVITEAQMQSCPFKDNLVKKEGRVQIFSLSKSQIPTLQEYLSQQGIAVYAIRYKKSLEDYFLKITQ